MNKIEKILFNISFTLFLIMDIGFIIRHFREIPVITLFVNWKESIIIFISAIVWITILTRYSIRKKKNEENRD